MDQRAAASPAPFCRSMEAGRALRQSVRYDGTKGRRCDGPVRQCDGPVRGPKVPYGAATVYLGPPHLRSAPSHPRSIAPRTARACGARAYGLMLGRRRPVRSGSDDVRGNRAGRCHSRSVGSRRDRRSLMNRKIEATTPTIATNSGKNSNRSTPSIVRATPSRNPEERVNAQPSTPNFQEFHSPIGRWELGVGI